MRIHVVRDELWTHVKDALPWNEDGLASDRRFVAAKRVWPTQPRIRVPLTADESDATLDLQEVFNVSYGIGPYPESLAYGEPPDPPLASDDQDWASELLRRHQLSG